MPGKELASIKIDKAMYDEIGILQAQVARLERELHEAREHLARCESAHDVCVSVWNEELTDAETALRDARVYARAWKLAAKIERRYDLVTMMRGFYHKRWYRRRQSSDVPGARK